METVKLDVTHSTLPMKMPELKFGRFQTIAAIKASLEKRVGTSAGYMDLVLKDSHGETICALNNDEASLGSYGPQDGYILHVIDTNPLSITKQLSEENPDVPKYKIEEDKYAARPDTFAKFKQNNPALFKPKPKVDDELEAEQAAKINVGNRCQVLKTKIRGEVKYVGKVPEKGPGYFIGILLDEPYGDNDGKYVFVIWIRNRIKGKEYFKANMKYGIFVRPSEMQIGDFPPEEMDEI